MNDWPYYLGAVAGLTGVTVVTRASFFMLPARLRLPVQFERALRYAPACALAAVIAQGVLTAGGRPAIGLDNDRMWGLIATCAVATRTRQMLVLMAVGFSVFTILRVA